VIATQIQKEKNVLNLKYDTSEMKVKGKHAESNRKHIMKSLIRSINKQSVLKNKNDNSEVNGSYWFR